MKKLKRIKRRPKVKVIKKYTVLTTADKLHRLSKESHDVRKLRILVVKDETAEQSWNKALVVPLRKGEKVIVCKTQESLDRGFVRVKHGEANSKVESILAIQHFNTLKGEKIWWKPMIEYKKQILSVAKLERQLVETPWKIVGSRTYVRPENQR